MFNLIAFIQVTNFENARPVNRGGVERKGA
jgi:hypothetical protein